MRQRGRELTTVYESSVGAILIAQLRSLTLMWLEFNSNLLLVEQVGALEDYAKGALTNLLSDAVADADDVRKGCGIRYSDWCNIL